MNHASWLWSLFLCTGALVNAQEKASLTVDLMLKTPEAGGTLRIAVCPDRKSYNKNDGCVLRDLPVEFPPFSLTIEELPPGTCAVKVYQDVNNDGELNKSLLGWPKEPWGFSNEAPVNMGEPPFQLAAITLKAGANTTRIILQ